MLSLDLGGRKISKTSQLTSQAAGDRYVRVRVRGSPSTKTPRPAIRHGISFTVSFR